MKTNSINYLTREGLRSVWVNRLMSLASISVLMACLIIIGSGAMLFFNITAMLDVVERQNVVMVYIEDEATDLQTSTVGVILKQTDNVANCEFVPKEDAYAAQLESLGADAVYLQGLEENPLPDAYKVTIGDLTRFSETVEVIKSLENVMSVRENSDLSAKLLAVRRAVTYIGVGIVAMLFLVSVFIIANTVRITMYSRRLEISIMKAVGATNSFIRWPFIVEGITLGIISGALSFGLVFAIYQVIVYFYKDIISVVGNQPVDFFQYGWWMLLLFMFIGVFTGSFGSGVSMGKYLKEQGSVVNDD